MSAETLLGAAGLALAYLIGSLPFGLLLTHVAVKVDVRKSGSGNIGATNVLRTAGPIPALATLALDVLKGFAAVWVARSLGPAAEPGRPLAAGSLYVNAALVLPVVGHCFPVWLRFRGGKGVATALGVLLALWWPGALAGVAVFAVVVLASRMVSLGSLAAAAALPLAMVLTESMRETYLPAGLIIAVIVIVRHRDNIGRLIRGGENRLGRTGGATGESP